MSHNIVCNYLDGIKAIRYKLEKKTLQFNPNDKNVNRNRILFILKELNRQKNKLDDLEDKEVEIHGRLRKWTPYMVFLLNPYSNDGIKNKLIKSYIDVMNNKPGFDRISNAYIKMLELITSFKLFDGNKIVFFNAEFPGDFINASIYYCTKRNISMNWVASSLIGTETELKDKYNLYKHNRSNWLMGDNTSGDLSNTNDIIALMENVRARYASGVDLYTCDVGMDVADNYNNQEQQHQKVQFGQIICMCKTLKKSGDMVCKFYTFSTIFTLSLFRYVAGLFREVYIFKPKASRCTNSEVYLIGKWYLDNANYSALIDYHANFDKYIESKPNLLGIDFNTEDLTRAFKEIYNAQIEALKIVSNEAILDDFVYAEYMNIIYKNITVPYIKRINPLNI